MVLYIYIYIYIYVYKFVLDNLIGFCCPTLRVTARGREKTEQSKKSASYEYYKLGFDGREIFKQINGQKYIYFQTSYNQWMVSHTFLRLSIKGKLEYVNLLFIMFSQIYFSYSESF